MGALPGVKLCSYGACLLATNPGRPRMAMLPRRVKFSRVETRTRQGGESSARPLPDHRRTVLALAGEEFPDEQR